LANRHYLTLSHVRLSLASQAALALTRFFNFFKNQKALAPPPLPKAKPTPRPKAQPVAAPGQMGRPASHTSPSKFVPPRVAGGAAASATTARAPQATSLVPPRAGVKRERVEEPTERPAPHARDATSPIKRERGEEATVTASEAQAYIRRVRRQLLASVCLLMYVSARS
jgi:hypothetical protein